MISLHSRVHLYPREMSTQAVRRSAGGDLIEQASVNYRNLYYEGYGRMGSDIDRKGASLLYRGGMSQQDGSTVSYGCTDKREEERGEGGGRDDE